MTNIASNVGRCVAFSLVLMAVPRSSVGQERASIHEAIIQKRVYVTASGAGIETVIGTVRRTSDTGPFVLSIPVGTLFVPDSSAVQTMVTVAETTIDLTTTESADFSARVACANRRLAIPSSATRFTVEPRPRQEELSAALPMLAETKAPYAVAQALVWIITDNATYADLGSLVRGNRRTINETDAARAMMSMERSGVDLTRRGIWSDRQRVCMCIGTADPDVTAWCRRIVPDITPAGSLEVDVQADDRSYAKSSEFQITFPISGAQNTPEGKPDINVDFNFYRRLPEGEKFFNRTAPQHFNTATLPGEFCTALGHKLVAGVGVPLTSFPAGNYRLEIKVTDKVSSQIATRNVNFTVLPE